MLDPSSIQIPEHDALTFAVAADKAEYKALVKDAPALIYREDKASNAGCQRFIFWLGRWWTVGAAQGAPELVGGLFSLIGWSSLSLAE